MKVTISFTKMKVSSKETMHLINKTNADYLHIDLMDGKFVVPKQQLIADLKKIMPFTTKMLDVHLMAAKPLQYLAFFAEHNTEYFTFHLEAVSDIEKTIEAVKTTGLKVGLALKLETDVDMVLPFVHLIDQVLIMSCEVGYGGTPFNDSCLEKIRILKKYREDHGLNYLISVDGGINEETISLVKIAGTDMVVSGSYICMSGDYQKNIDQLKL